MLSVMYYSVRDSVCVIFYSVHVIDVLGGSGNLPKEWQTSRSHPSPKYIITSIHDNQNQRCDEGNEITSLTI